MELGWFLYTNNSTGTTFAIPTVALVSLLVTLVFLLYRRFTMAEATAADGKMKDLSISETKKSKKDGNPQKAAKKPQQQKKKVRQIAWNGMHCGQDVDCATD
jgi:mannitol-specific phosphotransferase system IIBC component